jgi:uncharacterized membrane protein YdbT with pleckstrin-like domain
MGYVDSLLARNERIVLITRQHWSALVMPVLIDVVLFVLISAVALSLSGVARALGLVVVLPVAHLIIRLLNWLNVQYIVTTRRVLEIHGVINKRVSDSSLEKVNDVVLEQSILGRFLNYGTVAIITGSDIGVNYFKHIAHPVHFKIEMLNQKEEFATVDTHSTQAKSVLAKEPVSSGEIPDLIVELDELRKKGIITEDEFVAKKAELLGRL